MPFVKKEDLPVKKVANFLTEGVVARNYPIMETNSLIVNLMLPQ